jgi:NhaA family Na+:H+ antiporter
VSPCDRLINALHPWTSWFIVPIFALANAGIAISGDSLSSPSSVLVGVAVALVVGKFVGVTLFSFVAVKVGVARLPPNVRWGHIGGVGAVAGIGFTVSLFITGLAFDSEILQDDAKLGTLMASVIAAVLGSTLLAVVPRRSPAPVDHEPT